VTFTGTPEAMHSVIAGRPSAVRVAREQWRHLQRHPAVDAVRALMDRQASAARRRSSIASSRKSSSSESPVRDRSRIASS
jgi:hypothetical protein